MLRDSPIYPLAAQDTPCLGTLPELRTEDFRTTWPSCRLVWNSYWNQSLKTRKQEFRITRIWKKIKIKISFILRLFCLIERYGGALALLTQMVVSDYHKNYAAPCNQNRDSAYHRPHMTSWWSKNIDVGKLTNIDVDKQTTKHEPAILTFRLESSNRFSAWKSKQVWEYGLGIFPFNFLYNNIIYMVLLSK